MSNLSLMLSDNAAVDVDDWNSGCVGNPSTVSKNTSEGRWWVAGDRWLGSTHTADVKISAELRCGDGVVHVFMC